MIEVWSVSERHACRTMQAPRSTQRYKSHGDDQADLKKRIKEIAETRVRYGYRRIHVMLRREGWTVNAKRVYRLYHQMGLQLRNKTPRRRVKAKLRDDRKEAITVNETWAIIARQAFATQMLRGDFVHDQFVTGRRLRVLTVVDTFSRFLPVVDPRFNYKGEDVVRTLDQACKLFGYPKSIRADNGPEFVSRDLDLWAYQNDVILDFSRPGRPTDNAFIESFNGKFRAECLNAHWFLNLDDARSKLESWRRDYNEVRPHSAIGYKTPITLLNPAVDASPP